MGGDRSGRCRACQTVAVTLLLCSLALCLNLQVLGKKIKHEGSSETAVKDGRKGSILFNGKRLKSQSGPASSAAATGHALLQVDLHQSSITESRSKLKNDTANEAAWRQLNSSLHCSDNKMKLKAMGPGAADLQLHIENAKPLPLKHVPDSCGFSMQQNALGLVLNVPYNACSVLTENGRYVLPMNWRGMAVEFICPVQQSRKFPFSLRPWHFHRSRRQAKQPYYPNLYNSYWYNYYMHMMAPGAKTNPTTTRPHTKPPGYSYPLYYPYNFYYPYYSSSSYFLPVKTTVPPATTTVAPPMAVRPSGNKIPSKSPAYYPPHFPNMHYLPPVQQLQMIPDKTQVYYYNPETEYFFGKPSYQQKPNLPKQPTWSQFTPVAMPSYPANPVKLSYPSPVSPETSAAPIAPYVPFDKLPFEPYVVYKAKKLPDDQKYIAKAGFKSRFQTHSGFPLQIASRFPQ
ncbi:uncharacterized protein LOC102304805 isoform X2 [Haplochromis burtoni]|uniref:uncharacterized protein LOC102304805 isoform X2 n=1 Tax=Haplochromis burtoni TaxID=8153 RepID=UPI001C2D1F87|nr:uncharacterized protein LOC102304805 isoform X2 [Haplochromis burtoni]